jgi:Holliday junction resolvase RusA-like endonuclease
MLYIQKNGKAAFRFTVPIPPTDNHAYVNIRNARGGRRLSKEALTYKTNVAQIISIDAAQSPVSLPEQAPYFIDIKIFFPRVKTKIGAKNRYMNIDVTNRTKLLLDAITEPLGIDDRHIFMFYLYKKCDPKNPRVEVHLREIEDKESELETWDYEKNGPLTQ